MCPTDVTVSVQYHTIGVLLSKKNVPMAPIRVVTITATKIVSWLHLVAAYLYRQPALKANDLNAVRLSLSAWTCELRRPDIGDWVFSLLLHIASEFAAVSGAISNREENGEDFQSNSTEFLCLDVFSVKQQSTLVVPRENVHRKGRGINQS